MSTGNKSNTVSNPRDFGGHVFGDEDNISQGQSNCCRSLLIGVSYFLVAITFPFSLCCCVKVVQEYERAVIFRLGRLISGHASGPGLFFILPCIDDYICVDLRTRYYEVPAQRVLSKDSLTVEIEAIMYYRVSNPTVAVANIESYSNATELLAETTVRNIMGSKFMHEILTEREKISKEMHKMLDQATEKWGVAVERIEIKDVRLSPDMQRIMAAEAEANREARAKVIDAEGELKASRALREAAEIMSASPAAMQLRYLQTLNAISTEKTSLVVFPLPVELFMRWLRS